MLVVLETNVVPYALKEIIDTIANHQGDKRSIFNEIRPALWLGGLAWLGSMALLRLIHWWEAYVIPRFEANVRLSVLNHIISHSYQYFSNQLSGDIANKVKELPRAIVSIKDIVCWNCMSTLWVVLVTLIMIVPISPLFSCIFAAWIVIHFVITILLVKYINNASEKNAEDKSILDGIVVDIISNITFVKLFASSTYELEYTKDKQAKEIISNRKLINSMNIFQICIYMPIMIMLGSTVFFLVSNWQSEHITTGEFVFIFSMLFFISQQMWHLSNALANLFRDIGAAQQAIKFINSPQQVLDVPNALPIKIDKGEIIFRNVTFNYEGNVDLFKNQTVIIKPGEKVGLVGLSGSGKSTFVNLILRLFDVESGVITIDGQDIRTVTQDSLRKGITMIPQNNSLFHRTLSDNLCYGQTGISHEEMIVASKNAHCHDFIMQFKDKYNSLVGEHGAKLSGGQRQRIAIARAMLKDTHILILDEATSSLDSLTEKNIQAAFYELMHGRTTLVIAHRLSTLSQMDRILVFNNGNIVEDGHHEVLLQKEGHYAKLWEMQIDGLLPNKENVMSQMELSR